MEINTEKTVVIYKRPADPLPIEGVDALAVWLIGFPFIVFVFLSM